MNRPLIGWARVSSQTQDLNSQVQELQAAGCRKIFQGKHSGAGDKNEQALAELLDYLREGDCLVVTKIDRLGRSLRQVLNTLDTLQAKGVSLKALHQPIDTDIKDPLSTAMLQLLGMFAEMERNFIKERTAAGKIASGNHGGRPPRLTPAEKKSLLTDRAKGRSLRNLADAYGVSLSTVMRVLRASKQSD